MKKILIAALAATAFATPAFAADTDTVNFDITANVAPECSIETPSTFNVANVNIVETPGPDALTITGLSQAPNQNIWMSCNQAAKITVHSQNGGLLNAANAAAVNNDPADFTNVINYRLGFGSNGSEVPNVTLATKNGDTTSRDTNGAFHYNSLMVLHISESDNTLRPVSGTYEDTVEISLATI